MSIDTIGDFLTIIRNGVLASKRQVVAPYSLIKHQVAQILQGEGFIKGVIVKGDTPQEKHLVIDLKYVDGESVIHEITRVSKPGRRIYKSAEQVKPVIGGLGIAILTTPRGVVSHKKAQQISVGGEVICTVW